jgi:hypothetical protein
MMARRQTPREQAESLFSKMTLHTSTRNPAFEKLAAIKAIRDQKTQRLREARLGRDVQESTKPALPAPSGQEKP